jgi:transposase-like protein
MPAKKKPTETDADLNLSTLAPLFVDEDKARKFLEEKRWPNGPVCPHCGGEGYALTAKPDSKRPGRPGLKKCKACRKQFTVRVGTIFEESKIPLSKWLMAIHLMTSSKKGVSSRQIERELGVTIKTAWFITHRIREAMKEQPLAGMLQGAVEVDETYMGGKPRYNRGHNKRGRGTQRQPVVVLVEREGKARCTPVDNVRASTLRSEIAVNVAKESVIVTDELKSYRGLKKMFAGHEVIRHSTKEYARKNSDGFNVTTNTAESFFALLKRGHYGIFHKLSKRHLHRYCAEFAFRWNHRKVSDGERMVAAILGAEGKRLRYA